MSETLSLLSGLGSQISNINSLGSAVAAIGSVGQLLVGGGPITLGSFQFENFEIPSAVDYAGGQKTVHHEYPGGARSMSVMGRNDRNISFSGTFLSQDAVQRSQTLDQMRISGQPLALSFGNVYEEVVIEDLQLRYLQSNRIDYQISLYVQSINPNSSTPTLLQAVTSDIGNALGVNIPATLSTVSGAIRTVQTAAQDLTSLTGGSKAALSLLGTVNSAQSVVSGAVTAANGQIGALSSTIGNLTGAAAAASNINLLTTQAGNLAAGKSVQAFMGRIANNLTGGVL
jgi:hypothetical protein